MPVGPRAILERMLGNLQHVVPAARPEGGRVGRRACASACPGITLSQRGDLAGLLGRLGQFAEAARELDVLADAPARGGRRAGRGGGREPPGARQLSDGDR